MQVVEDGVAAIVVGEGEEGAELVPAAPLERLTLPGDDGGLNPPFMRGRLRSVLLTEWMEKGGPEQWVRWALCRQCCAVLLVQGFWVVWTNL